MTATIAHKTMAAISAAMEEDQGASFRLAEKELLPKMADAYRGKEDRHRSHFGYSNLGDSCARKLWYSWKWVLPKSFPARILRLFNRGHLEEARFLSMLISAKFEVYYETQDGGQFKISDHNGHSGSAIDGVVVGIPDLQPGIPALVEMKTHSDKSFKEVVRKGMRESKWVHYVQMQVYMKKYDLQWGLYMAVNKNDDNLYCEIVSYDPAVAEKYLDRASMLIYADEAPQRINESPGWYECKFCDFKNICHQKQLPEINCRTCMYSSPVDNSEWECSWHKTKISKADQLQGCRKHLLNPHLINGAIIGRCSVEEGWLNITWNNKGYVLGKGGLTTKEFIKKHV